VVGEHEVRQVGDEEAPVNGYAGLDKLVDLGEKLLGVDDHAVAHDADLAGANYPRRHEVEHVLAPPRVYGVPRVGAALEADDDIGALGEIVYDFGLTLVAPLGATIAFCMFHP